METPQDPSSIDHRIREGLARLGVALRIDEWNKAKASGLNPTQRAILELLEGRGPAGLSVKEIAAHLGVSQPTATDSINALERKHLVGKHTTRADRRAVSVVMTAQGLETLRTSGEGQGFTDLAVAGLDADARQQLLLTLIRMIRQFQDMDAIPVQRMCVNCRYFAPNVHTDAEKPHHCKFVDAAFGQRELRIDCRDHVEADPASRAATWDAFQAG